VSAKDRVAGLLILLYAQQAAALSRLTLKHIQVTDQRVHIRQDVRERTHLGRRVPQSYRPTSSAALLLTLLASRFPLRARRSRRQRNLAVAVSRRMADRTFRCEACGYTAGRDRNAARTILATVERDRAGADDVRHSCPPSGAAAVLSEPEIPRP
jgi:hypothetical protein